MLAMTAFGYPGDYALLCLALLSLLLHTWCFFKLFPRKGYPKAGLVLGNLLVLVCMLGLTGMAGETYLRFVSIKTDAFGMSLPARRWFAVYTELNSLGCRDVEWSLDKPPGVRRIAFVGDSFAFGWGIERVEDRYTERLQAMFDRRAPETVQIMNVAKPGWDTGAQFQPVRDMIEHYGVDEVVLCYVPNDIEKLLPTTDDFDPIRPPQPRLFDPESSCMMDYLYRALYLPRVATVHGYHDWLAEGFANTDTWRLHQQQLGAIISHCRDHDVTFRVVIQPFLRTVGEKFQPLRLHAVMEAFFQANGVPVVDLLEAVAGRDLEELMVNHGDPHPNAAAHALFAEEIWQAFYKAPAGVKGRTSNSE